MVEERKTEYGLDTQTPNTAQELALGLERYTSVIKKNGSSSRGPAFQSQHPHGDLQLSVT